MKVDWQMILLDLRRDYMSLASIANIIGCHPKTLQKVARNGADDMMYSTGSKLIAMHDKYCKYYDRKIL